MADDELDLIYLSVGPIAAISLGVALIPLREVVIASNLTFFFLALIIVIAERGGRWPAVATALVSALSLDFFLTKPYLHLSIQDKHDVYAFVGLAACGLLVAALGSGRRQGRAELKAVRRRSELVRAALSTLEEGGVLFARAQRLLEMSRGTLPISALVLRSATGSELGSSPSSRPAPSMVLDSVTVRPIPTNRAADDESDRLPAEGARLRLINRGHHVGWLDIWGGRGALTALDRITLAEVASIAAALIAAEPVD